MTAGATTVTQQTTVTFIRLKLSILRNGLRQSRGRTIGYTVAVSFALLYAVGTLLGMIALRGNAHSHAVSVTFLAVLALGWAVVPVFFFGGDETLDPTRLAMLPLRPRRLVTGLLCASLIGMGPLVTVIMAAGAMVAVAGSGAAAAIAVPAVALTLLLCVALARAVAAANTRLLTSRKGRDLALMSGLIIAVGAQLVNLGLQKLSQRDGLKVLEAPAAVLRWIPPASAADAVRAAGDGDWGRAVIGLVLVVVAIALALWWWERSLTKLMVSPDYSTVQAAGDSRDTGGSAGLSRWLPEGRTGTVMLRHFRYAWRDPRSKAAWATALGIGLLLPIVWSVQGNGTVYAAIWASGLLGMQMYNQFGVDGSAFWTVASTISTRQDAYGELRARALTLATVAVPYTCVVATFTAALLHGWPALPETLGLALALLGCLLAVGSLASVLFPYAVPQDNAFQNAAPGQGGLVAVNLLGGLLCGAALTLPVIAATIALHVAGGAASDFRWLILPVGALYGAAALAIGLRVAAVRLLARLPEVLAAAARG